MKRKLIIFLTLLIPNLLQAQINYNWKLGVYNAPQFYSFVQKENNLGNAKGNAFIIENVQLTVQRKFDKWLFDSAINYSSLNLESPDTKETVNLYSLFLGTIYKQQWILNLQYEQVPIIDSSKTVKDFNALNTTWLSAGYQRKVLHPRIQIFGIVSYPLLMSSGVDSIEGSSGYKLNIGADYRVRLQRSWDLYLRPFMEYKHWQVEFNDLQDETDLTIVQYGIRFGVNKFF